MFCFNIEEFSFCLTENSVRLHYKDQWLMVISEIVVLFF
jgi:hypothetical protein